MTVDLEFLHNAVHAGDFTEDVCRGLLDLLAEVTQLRELVDFQRRQAEIHCAKIAELDGENQQLRAELAESQRAYTALQAADAQAVLNLRAELAAAREALPEAGRLVSIAGGMRMDALLLKEDDPTCPLIEDAAQYLIAATTKIREARGETS